MSRLQERTRAQFGTGAADRVGRVACLGRAGHRGGAAVSRLQQRAKAQFGIDAADLALTVGEFADRIVPDASVASPAPAAAGEQT